MYGTSSYLNFRSGSNTWKSFYSDDTNRTKFVADEQPQSPNSKKFSYTSADSQLLFANIPNILWQRNGRKRHHYIGNKETIKLLMRLGSVPKNHTFLVVWLLCEVYDNLWNRGHILVSTFTNWYKLSMIWVGKVITSWTFAEKCRERTFPDKIERYWLVHPELFKDNLLNFSLK